ncbi:MAG: hypothetical protein L0K86_14395, partial [Actinomycetia bacterium]|nr:hypothetical protein [Actinomycetes bacterium]
MTASWKVPDEPDEAVAADSKPLLVSLHFLRTTLLRRWRVWVGLACIGMILSLVWTVLVPPPSEGTTSLMLAHESDAEPATAMETDVSLLRTRTVAESVIDELGLNMAPEDFQALVAAEPVTSSVLVLTVQAPDDAAAIARIESLSENFLDFRAEQIESQSKAVVQSYRKRVSELEVKVTTLTNQYRSLTERADETDEFGNPIDPADPEQVSSLLTQRTQVNGEIDELKQAIADASLETGSIVIASHAVDPPSIVPRSPARRLVLAMMSGLIGGAALGIGYVLVVAVTTDRIRRREEVASALGTPVRFSAGRPKGRHWWHAWRTRSGASGSRDLEILVRGLDEAVRSIHPEPVRLAVATIGGTEAAERAVTCLATRLAESGVSVVVVDLTAAGRLDRELT